jgi:Flp pilus assembly pilin Flp
MKNMRKLMKRQDGQGMTEYIIIVALIAISCIVVVAIFGDNIRKMFGSSANAVANSATDDTSAKLANDTSTHKNVLNFANHDH